MFELLFFVLSIIFVIGFIMPLVVSWFAIGHLKMDNVGLWAIVMGFLIAFFVSSILYLSVATISHSLTYSNYGSKFSEFYDNLSFKTTLFANIILILLWFDRTFIGNKNFSLSLLTSYQMSLFLLFILNPLLVLLLEKLGLIDLSIAYFAKNMGILSTDVDIRKDLITPKLSNSSFIKVGMFFFFNNILVILMMIRLWRINKHNRQSNEVCDDKSNINQD